MNVGLHKEEYERTNVEVTGAARLYRAASVWTAGLAEFTTQALYRHRIAKELHQRRGVTLRISR